MAQADNPTASGGAPGDYGSLCQMIRLALEPVRALAVSLHDETGDLLWLTESSMGPDEHNAVQQAFESFAGGTGPTAVAYDLGDSRSAVLFRVTNAKRAMVGAAMVIVDTRVVSQTAHGAAQLLTQKVLRALGSFAVMRRRMEPTPTTEPTPTIEPAQTPAQTPAPTPKAGTQALHDVDLSELTLTPMREINLSAKNGAPQPAARPTAPPAPRAAARPAPSPLAPAMPAPVGRAAGPENVPADLDRLNEALRSAPIALYVQRLIPLSKGSELKLFEVLLRSKADEAQGGAPLALLKAAVEQGLGSMIDRRVITELIGWLARNPRICQDDDVRFSVNLTKTALHDEHFMKFVGMCLAKAALPPQTVAFEIDVDLAIKTGAHINDVAAALHRLGCPLVLDDFGLRTECFELLRLPGVRYIKLAPSITTQMRTDKLSQAAITALVQMARVLGLHTVAKRTETGVEQEWMTALGVDFIQSNALSPPVPIESLSRPAKLRRAP